MGFAQGVSGLNASSNQLDVIGNNIANSGTVGFKAGTVEFADVYAGSKVGLGTKVAAVEQSFSQGSVQSSSNALDTAITNGDGFFRMVSADGAVSYTRNGQFTQDQNGFIVNSSGLRLTGYQVDSSGNISGGTPSAIQLPTAEEPPSATTKYTTQLNLDSRSTAVTVTPFDPNNNNSYTYPSSGNVFDSLGNSHEMTNYFVKTGSNTWDVYASLDGTVVNGGAKIGTMAFDSSGKLITDPAATPTTTGAGVMNVPAFNFGNGSAPLSFNVDINSSTQFGNANDPKTLVQDGYTSGQLTSYSIGTDGKITGTYSNEQTKTLGQVVLASFANPNGLKSVGDNEWSETADSGQPLIGSPGPGTKVGSLTSGSTEASNVDLTTELVNLIVAQRTYQANAQTVKTQDQILTTLVNLGQ
jgi:flagellar hook protein FlgE